jgi:dienelactone hydrolase
MGSSGGSYLAALLGIEDYPEDRVSSKVQAVVAMKGKYGTDVPGDTTLALKGLSPFHSANAATVPTLLIHAREDPLCPYAGVVAYQQRLLELGVRCDLITDSAASHRLDDKSLFHERVLPAMGRYFGEVFL